MIVFTKCYPKDSRHDTGSNKQLLPSLINLNVFSSGQTLYLENCSSINCLAWHCLGRGEVFTEIQDILRDNGTGRGRSLYQEF